MATECRGSNHGSIVPDNVSVLETKRVLRFGHHSNNLEWWHKRIPNTEKLRETV
jgi:hypothetical protein